MASRFRQYLIDMVSLPVLTQRHARGTHSTQSVFSHGLRTRTERHSITAESCESAMAHGGQGPLRNEMDPDCFGRPKETSGPNQCV